MLHICICVIHLTVHGDCVLLIAIFALMSGAGIELHEAASMGEYDVLQDLLKSGKYDVNLRDPEWQNRTPLHWACTKGYVDCVRLLMDYRANGLIKMDMGWTPAHCAAEAGKLNCLRALHQCGVQLDVKDKYGDSPRRVAEIYGHAECVKFLTQYVYIR